MNYSIWFLSARVLRGIAECCPIYFCTVQVEHGPCTSDENETRQQNQPTTRRTVFLYRLFFSFQSEQFLVCHYLPISELWERERERPRAGEGVQMGERFCWLKHILTFCQINTENFSQLWQNDKKNSIKFYDIHSLWYSKCIENCKYSYVDILFLNKFLQNVWEIEEN